MQDVKDLSIYFPFYPISNLFPIVYRGISIRISTKGRYALRVMIDLAKNGKDNFVKLQELSNRQQISEKYLEGILGTLVRAKVLEGARGKGGGYKLKCDPGVCSVWDILSLTETSVAPVSCLEDEENTCARAPHCITLPVWKELDTMIREYLQNVKLVQFIHEEASEEEAPPKERPGVAGFTPRNTPLSAESL